jgi:hypothetical protein
MYFGGYRIFLFSKNHCMKTFINKSLILALLLISKRVNAQNYNDYRDAEAVMLQVNGDVYTEKKLDGAIVALPDNSSHLVVKLHIPYFSINEDTAEDSANYLPDYHFNLKMKIDPWEIQESLTSGKTFDAEGYLTLNHLTKLVPVEYSPLPSLTVRDGSFNLNLIMEFNPADFNLGARDTNTRFIIRIGDAPVNRL